MDAFELHKVTLSKLGRFGCWYVAFVLDIADRDKCGCEGENDVVEGGYVINKLYILLF